MTTTTPTPETNDLNRLESMLSYAMTNELLHEVVEAYLGYRGNGDSVAEARQCALYDWDL